MILVYVIKSTFIHQKYTYILIHFTINQILNLNWKIAKLYYMDFPIHSIPCAFLRRPPFLFRSF